MDRESGCCGASTAKGLIVDYGGVLVGSQRDVVANLVRILGEGDSRVRAEQVEAVFADASALIASLRHGALTIEECSSRLDARARELGVVPPEGGMLRAAVEARRTTPTLHELVRVVRGCGVKTALLSNSSDSVPYDRSGWEGLFDVVMTSDVTGLRKPTSEAYTCCLNALNLSGHEAVFVDDQPCNLEPARQLGIRTVHHESVHETILEVLGHLGDDVAHAWQCRCEE